MSIPERIIKEAFHLFMRQGIRSVTMDDIANHMGISKRTIYENFRDKDELVRSCILWHKEEQNLQKKLIFSTSSNVLESFYRIIYQFMMSMKNTHPNLFSDIKKYHFSICEELVNKYQSESINEIETMIQMGKEEELFKDDVSTEITAIILNLQLKALSDDQIFSPEKYLISEVFYNIVVTFTRGIATEKGMIVINQLIDKWEKNELIN